MDESKNQEQEKNPKAPAVKKRGLLSRFIDRHLPTLRLLGRLRSPIFMKEMRAAFRRRRFFVAHTITVSVIGVVILVSAFYFAEQSGGGTRLSSAQVGEKLFEYFILVQILLTCLVYPAFGCTSITDERANKSFDLLVTSNLQPWEIVYGKFIATFVYSSVFILTTIPFVWLSMLFGAITPGKIALTYFFLILFSIVVTLLSVFVSSLFESPSKAVITTYGAMLFAALIFYFAGNMPGDASAAEAAEGAGARTGMFAGVVDMLSKVTDKFSTTGTTGYQRTYMFLYPMYFFLTFCAFFFMLASNRLKPPSYNRSTSMKLFVVFSSLLIILIVFGHFFAAYKSECNQKLEKCRIETGSTLPALPTKEEIEDEGPVRDLSNSAIKRWTEKTWYKVTWQERRWNWPDGHDKPYNPKNWKKYRLPRGENKCPDPEYSWKRVEKNYTENFLPAINIWGLEKSRLVAGVAFLFCFITVLFFSGEPLVPSLRIRTRVFRLRGWKRILKPFAPGSANGVVFSLVFSAVIFTSISLYFYFAADLHSLDYENTGREYRGWYSCMYFPIVFWIFLLFVAQLTLFLSTTRAGPLYGKLFTFFLVLILTLAPILPWAARVKAHWWTGYAMSPIFMIFSIWKLPSMQEDIHLVTSGAGVFVWSMIVYSSLGFTLATINLYRLRRLDPTRLRFRAGGRRRRRLSKEERSRMEAERHESTLIIKSAKPSARTPSAAEKPAKTTDPPQK
ncbi:MAG: ABC transporter permease [Planctomycetota bacterium]|nr:MAG: ABC transporter permease [Planctomycetota bacterium]